MGMDRKFALRVSILAVGLFLGVVKPAQAQEVAIGIRGGLNASYTIFEVEERAAREARPGLIAGGTFGYWWRPWMAFQTEVLFTQKGWGSAEGEGGMRVSYLEVPLLLRLQHSSALQPHFLIGPTFAVEVACSFDGISGAEKVDCDHSLISLDRPALDAGVLTGAGIGVRVGPGNLYLDALLSLGLVDVIREPLPRGAQTNFALSLSLAYTLDVHGGRGENR